MSACILDSRDFASNFRVSGTRRIAQIKHCVRLIIRVRSLVLVETNLISLLSEASSAEHDLVLSDETDVVGANSALTGIFTVIAGV